MAMVLALLLTLLIPLGGTVKAADTLRAAKIAESEGTVKIKKAGGEKQFSAFKGMGLAEGDTVITGKASWASIEMDDDKEIRIGENTQINISELKGAAAENQTGISLWTGKVWAGIKKTLNVRSKFEIKTSTTVAGVRGTQFFVGQEEGKTDVAVLEGTVSATAYIPAENDSTGSTTGTTEVETILQANQQITIDDSVQTSADIQVQPVNVESLDLFILEGIQESGQVTNQTLLNNVSNQIQIIQQQEQLHPLDGNEDETTIPEPPPTPVYEPDPAVTPDMTGTSSGDTDNYQQQEVLPKISGIGIVMQDGKLIVTGKSASSSYQLNVAVEDINHNIVLPASRWDDYWKYTTNNSFSFEIPLNSLEHNSIYDCVVYFRKEADKNNLTGIVAGYIHVNFDATISFDINTP
jgi:hypothetical protein